MLKQLILATGNPGKRAEFETLARQLDWQFVLQSARGVEPAAETGLSFIENALLKARHAARHTGLPALADDSGLCVDALNGAPGIHSARYAGGHGDHDANIDRLLHALSQVPEPHRGAHYVCVLALVRHADDQEPVLAEGRWPGRILLQRHGTGGFGYDPVFHDLTHAVSVAQMEAAQKNRISHRGRAFATLVKLLASRPLS